MQVVVILSMFCYVFSNRLEDGTLPFLDILALRHGFATLSRLAGSMATVARHTFQLAKSDSDNNK